MKAFDKVPHQRLIIKMESYGIKGSVLEWVKKFLTHRKQRVLVDGKFSAWADVTSGIPQGSVLGPTLFLIYINDLPDEIQECKIKMFADDTKLYKEIKDEEDCKTLQENIDRIHHWSSIWQLKFHPDKCHVMRMGRNRPDFQYTMPTYENTTHILDVTNSEKDLGVYIDSELNFRDHVAKTVSKANKILGIIRRTFRYLDRTTLVLLYKTLVRPILEYGYPAWAPLNVREKDELEAVQRRATKLISTIRHLPYQDRLISLKLFSLSHRRQRGDMIFVYK